MNKKSARIICVALAMGLVAVVYSITIFSNLCMDGDTLGWAASLEPLKGEMTLLNAIAVKGWFSKFHLLMFPLVYLCTKAYAFVGRWDFLTGFKICTLLCAVGTVPLLYYICAHTIRRFGVRLVISVIPLFTLGYSWMITTCDDNVLANFFNLIFLLCVLVASGAIRERLRERRALLLALVAGIAAGLSMASHLKNIVSLPLLFAPAVVKPPPGQSRLKIALAALAGFILSFGLLYGLYWIQSTGEPVSSKLDFWVFHRVSGRFLLTPGPGRPALGDHLVFVLAGVRASLYAFQELFIHSDLYDGDLLGFLVIAVFFGFYLHAVRRTWNRRVVKILFALFVLHAGHSFLYDSWVVERWDYFTIPVFLTMGIHWDSLLAGKGKKAMRASTAILLFFGLLVWCNVRSARALIGITGNTLPHRPSATQWPFPKKVYFYFDHRGIHELARSLDGFLGEGTYFFSLKYMQESQSYVYVALDQYCTVYSEKYPERLITDLRRVDELAREGRLKKLLFLDRVKVPFYTGDAKSLVMFDPATTKTIFENRQVVLKEAVFTPKLTSK